MGTNTDLQEAQAPSPWAGHEWEGGAGGQEVTSGSKRKARHLCRADDGSHPAPSTMTVMEASCWGYANVPGGRKSNRAREIQVRQPTASPGRPEVVPRFKGIGDHACCFSIPQTDVMQRRLRN